MRAAAFLAALVVAAPQLAHADGAALLARGECGRCHAVAALGVPEPARERSCTGCHRWIVATRDLPAEAARWRRVYPDWDRYVTNVSSFLSVPDLATSAARLRPEFVAAFLRAPWKIRPSLPESMPRTAYDEAQADELARWLTTRGRSARPWSTAAAAAAAVPPSQRAADVAEGARLYARLGCNTCHDRGDWRAASHHVAAPDLAHVARRMSPEDAAAFIADPAAFGGEPRMPSFALAPQEAARLRDYLFSAAPRPPSPPNPPADLPLLTRPVRFAEVRTRVFAKTCVHCHMDERRGDGGPGNTGGLGFRGAGLDLEKWSGVRRGAIGADGRRHSVLSASTGEAPVVTRLRRRVHEHAAELVGAPLAPSSEGPGMPLGLPPVTPEELQLVRSWVAQGAR